MPTLHEVGGQLEKLRSDYKTTYESFELKTLADGSKARDIPANQVETLRKLQDDINAKQDEFTAIRSVEEFGSKNGEELEQGRKVAPTPQFGRQPMRAKSAGELAVEMKIASREGIGRTGEVDVDAKAWLGLDAKTTMTTSSGGYAPEILRDGNVVPIAYRPPQLIDFLRVEPTNQNGIKFMAQTVRTNNAAAKAENAAFDEAAITYAEQTDIISAIGTFIPVTEEQLEDEPGIRQLIDSDLAMMVRQILDDQITVGSGVDPILCGIYTGSGIGSQARGNDPVLDALMKGITKVNVTGRANAGLMVMHTTDHQNLALSRTADGIYLLGNPTDSAFMRVWGLPIVKSDALTVTNAMVVDPNYFRVKMRKGVTIAVTDSHASNFTSRVIVVRAHVRAGIQRLREAAACKVTGLP